VDGLYLAVRPGSCLGLLGPNGAGKSTTMRMITGLARPDRGSIEVFGLDVATEPKRARAQMGVVPQEENLDFDLTARQNLEITAALQRIPRRSRAAAIDAALAVAQLEEKQKVKVGKLSGGMKRRLLIARGLIHSPRLVLLDEPTVGLDPQVRSELWTLIDKLRSEGVAVLMSTHYIEEAERLADDVAVVAKGRVVATGTPAALRAAHVGEQALEYYGPPERLEAVESLAARAGAATRRTGPAVSVLRAEALHVDVREEMRAAALGAPLERLATLEDVFVLLTGEQVG
jgi:lipooligosaccharide transport system ATP-binding protein